MAGYGFVAMGWRFFGRKRKVTLLCRPVATLHIVAPFRHTALGVCAQIVESRWKRGEPEATLGIRLGRLLPCAIGCLQSDARTCDGPAWQA